MVVKLASHTAVNRKLQVQVLSVQLESKGDSYERGNISGKTQEHQEETS